MKKRLILSVVLLFLFGFHCSSYAALALKIPKMPKIPKIPTPFFLKKNKIIESSDITSIMSKVDRHTIVVFDIDYTMFRPTTYLGTREWARHLLLKELHQTQNKELCFQRNYAIWLKAQQFNEIELMDPRIPRILKDLKSKSLGYIALTDRQGSAFEVTQWQLNKFDIDFIKSPFAGYNYESQAIHPAVYREGILFSHNFNDKSLVFKEWLQQVKPQLKKMRSMRRVVYIDESLDNIQAMQQAVESLGLDFFGVRYSRADEFRKGFTPRMVETEKRILMGNYSDSEIRLMLEDAGSYVEQYE